MKDIYTIRSVSVDEDGSYVTVQLQDGTNFEDVRLSKKSFERSFFKEIFRNTGAPVYIVKNENQIQCICPVIERWADIKKNSLLPKSKCEYFKKRMLLCHEVFFEQGEAILRIFDEDCFLTIRLKESEYNESFGSYLKTDSFNVFLTYDGSKFMVCPVIERWATVDRPVDIEVLRSEPYDYHHDFA